MKPYLSLEELHVVDSLFQHGHRVHLTPARNQACKILKRSLIRCRLSLATTLCESVESFTPLLLFPPFFFSLLPFGAEENPDELGLLVFVEK
jgi:predicted phosphohydrolase